MQGPIGFTEVVTIPPGAQPGQQRIVIDGTRGAIFEYNTPGNTLVSSWAASAGTDQFGNAYPQGFNIGPGSVFSGLLFDITQQGFFVYQQQKGAGYLVASGGVSPSTLPPPLLDRFGNSVLPGFTVYFNNGGLGSLTGQITAVNLSVNLFATRSAPQYNAAFNTSYSFLGFGSGTTLPVLTLQPTTTTGNELVFVIGLVPDTHGRLFIDASGNIKIGPGGSATSDTTLGRVIAGGLGITNYLYIAQSSVFPSNVTGFTAMWADVFGDLFTQGSLVIGTTNNFIQLAHATAAPGSVAAAERIVGSGANMPFSVGASGQGWFLQGCAQNDPNVPHTVTQAAFTQISGTWTIDANDASLNDIYRLELRGHGTQGTTAQALTLAAFGTGNCTVPVTSLPANTAFTWRFVSEIVITNAAGNICNVHNELVVTPSGGVGVVVANQQTAAVFNIASANNFVAQAEWASITGAPSITCDSNWIEKKA